VEVVKSAQKEKVVRVGLLSLRNLLGEPELGAASDMVEAGLTKVLATRGLQVRVVGLALCSCGASRAGSCQTWWRRD
jgi:hypothetical protein